MMLTTADIFPLDDLAKAAASERRALAMASACFAAALVLAGALVALDPAGPYQRAALLVASAGLALLGLAAAGTYGIARRLRQDLNDLLRRRLGLPPAA